MKQKPQLMKVKDVAKAIGVCDETVRRYARTGKLKSYRLGPRILRFYPKDVQPFTTEEI